ncbi:MAG: hypothetical protein QXW35_04550 [Candidatus Aenigmatarchaeota archaeon]
MSFVFDELVKDLDLNTKQTLTEYNLKHNFNLVNFTELNTKKEYLIRNIEIELNSSNTNNISQIIDYLTLNNNSYFTIKPCIYIGISYNNIWLYTLPFYYKVYEDRVELIDFLNIDNEFNINVSGINLYEPFGYTINQNKVIIKIPVTGYVLLNNKQFIDIKQHVLSGNNHMYKLITYSNFESLDIIHVILEYKLTTNYKFRYVTNYYLQNILNQQINFTKYSQLLITPLNASVFMQKKYIPIRYKYTDYNNRYTYTLIDYLAEVKNISNYESLYVMDLLIFSFLPIVYTDQIFLQLLCKPKIIKNIKVYNTDIVYEINNTMFAELRSDNLNNILDIDFKNNLQAKLFDMYSLIL